MLFLQKVLIGRLKKQSFYNDRIVFRVNQKNPEIQFIGSELDWSGKFVWEYILHPPSKEWSWHKLWVLATSGHQGLSTLAPGGAEQGE